MKPICRKSSKGAKRERRLGAYCGAIDDLCALLSQLTHVALWRFEKGRNPKTFPYFEK